MMIDAARLPSHRKFGRLTKIRQSRGGTLADERKGYKMRLYMRRSLFGYGNI
jgi:hypothetical protein